MADLNLPLLTAKEDQKLLIAAIENSSWLEQLAELFNTVAVKNTQNQPDLNPK